jgi:outer membrane protein assembly factor BamE (lipoprotein component of BamABCDE complex)
MSRNAARVLLVLCMSLCACGASEQWQGNYLYRGVNRLTSSEVRVTLGTPYEIRPLSGGEVNWYYFQNGNRPISSHMSGGASNQSGCVEYILHFDQDGILQRVNQENQPSCTDVFRHLSDD